MKALVCYPRQLKPYTIDQNHRLFRATLIMNEKFEGRCNGYPFFK